MTSTPVYFYNVTLLTKLYLYNALAN